MRASTDTAADTFLLLVDGQMLSTCGQSFWSTGLIKPKHKLELCSSDPFTGAISIINIFFTAAQ